MAKKERGHIHKLEHVKRRILVYKDWYKLTFPFNRFFRGVQQLHMRSGTNVYVRDVFTVDPYIAILIFWINEYHLEQITLPENPIVVDLGANIGMFSLDLKQRFPTAQITSYEPLPETFEILKLNAPFATLVQKAATGSTGTVQFSNVGAPTGLHVIEEGGITVETESLDDILKNFEKVDLLKIDIEGSEFDLLEKASPQTLAKVQRIIMEIHPPHSLEWGENFLKKNGFKTSWIDPEELIYAERV